MVNQIIFFLNSANLICRTTDISKYFRESLGIRDNESRLYLNRHVFVMSKMVPLFQFFFVRTSGFICGIYLISVPHLFLCFWCLRNAVLHDCGIFWVSSYIFGAQERKQEVTKVTLLIKNARAQLFKANDIVS